MSAITLEQIREAIRRTREARERVQHRHADAMIKALAQTARNWLDPHSPWRQRAVEQAPAATGFSGAMINEAVDLTFGAITEEALRELLVGELGDRRAIGPQLIAHFLAGNVPPPGIVSICCGLLLKSANLVKVSSRDPVFPALFVESLHAVDAELADCVAVLDWRRDKLALTEAALAEADTVIAYGDDETIAAIRRMIRPDARFLGYGHKLSFAVIAREAMTKENLPKLAQAAAFDASVYDQQGCLSPHVFYVEEGGQRDPREFAAALDDAMAAYQARVPRGQLSVEEAVQIAQLRGAYEFRSATDKTIALWPGRVGWLVIYEEDPTFTPSCLNRVVFVKPVERLERVPELVRRLVPHLSTVGIAPMDEKTTVRLAEDLKRLGVSRICPVGQMQRPPLSWQHHRF
jgi:hypothetical protein